MRTYVIQDDGDEVQLQLLVMGAQVGGALFPDDGTGAAFELAFHLGESWALDSCGARTLQ